MGYEFHPNTLKIFLSILLFSFFNIIINNNNKNSWQNYLLVYWFYLSFIPFLIFFSYNKTNISYVACQLIFMSVFSAGNLLKQKKFIRQKKIKNLEYYFLVISVFCGLFLYLQSPNFNLSSILLNAADVYDDRLAFRYKESSIVSSYIFEPIGRIIIPYLSVYFILKKKYWLFVFTFFLSIIYFLTTGSLKSMLFAPALVLFVFKINHTLTFRRNLVNFFLTILVLSLLEVNFFNTTILSNYSIRRLLFTPHLLGNIYFDYFQNFSPILGVFNPLETFDMPIARFVGAHLMDSPEARANVGIMIEFWLNFRLLGVFIGAIFIQAFFYFFDSVNLSKFFAPIIIPFLYYINTSFFGPLLFSHGFWILFIFIYIYNHDSSYLKKS
jgi:hypothetical protein